MEVVKILLVANKSNFAQLKIMCYSSIVNYHYTTFKKKYRQDVGINYKFSSVFVFTFTVIVSMINKFFV